MRGRSLVLELGFFIGKLKRSTVTALYRKDDKLEFSSDYDGILYMEFDAPLPHGKRPEWF